jgi:hypothetical protein
MSQRKKITPSWLSWTRKLMVYLGGSTVLIMTVEKLFTDPSTQMFAVQWYLFLLGIVQLVCDFSYKKDPLKDFPIEDKE